MEVATADVKAADGSAQGGPGDPGQVRGRGRALGLRGQAAPARGRPWSWSTRGSSSSRTNQLKSSIAARDQAKATIKKADAELLSRRAALAKAEVDVRVAEADLKVAESEERRLKAWVGYLTLTAPFDGVITARNANTFDFVLPDTGDPSANDRAPHLSPSGAPRRSTWSTAPTSSASSSTSPSRTPTTSTSAPRPPCWSRATATSRSRPTVTRTSWALNMKSRTLRAEIDLPNPGSQLLPGMYAYAKVIIERPEVRALPESALTYERRQGLLLDATRTGARCGPRSARASATASGSRSPIARSAQADDGAEDPGCRSTARSR